MKFPEGIMSNSWTRLNMNLDDIPKDHMYHMWVKEDCPKNHEPVSIYDCNKCYHGKAGNTKEGWVKCTFEMKEKKCSECGHHIGYEPTLEELNV